MRRPPPTPNARGDATRFVARRLLGFAIRLDGAAHVRGVLTLERQLGRFCRPSLDMPISGLCALDAGHGSLDRRRSCSARLSRGQPH